MTLLECTYSSRYNIISCTDTRSSIGITAAPGLTLPTHTVVLVSQTSRGTMELKYSCISRLPFGARGRNNRAIYIYTRSLIALCSEFLSESSCLAVVCAAVYFATVFERRDFIAPRSTAQPPRLFLRENSSVPPTPVCRRAAC